MGIKSIIYLDDGIAGKKSYRETENVGIIIAGDLEKAGLIANMDKSDFTPRQRGLWLGLIIDTRYMKFFLPQEKINKLKLQIAQLLSIENCTPKQISRTPVHT